jgi:hypothetical protein
VVTVCSIGLDNGRLAIEDGYKEIAGLLRDLPGAARRAPKPDASGNHALA